MVTGSNPFATVVMAHLKTQETSGDATARHDWKLALTRRLYERGYSRDDVVHLYRFIDWLMQLPKALEDQYWQAIEAYEGEKNMSYITYAERVGIEKGIQQGIQEGIQQGMEQGVRQGLLAAIELGLELKFGDDGLRLYPEIAKISDNAILHIVVKKLRVATTLAEVRRMYAAG